MMVVLGTFVSVGKSKLIDIFLKRRNVNRRYWNKHATSQSRFLVVWLRSMKSTTHKILRILKCRVLLLLEVLHIVEEGVMLSKISTC